MAEGTVEIGGNRLLGSLDERSRKSLMPHLTRVQLKIKEVVYKPGGLIRDIYFPIDGVVSLVAVTESGPSVEVATIGNEGMAGLPVFLGADRSPGSCFSQIPGAALRMSAAHFRKFAARNGTLAALLRLYTQALMVQISQGTACNRAHLVRERCARWLLLTHDRVRRDQFSLTQEFLGQMLGVRRATVNQIATELHRDGLIRYSRGQMTILNRRKLEAASCICYSIIRKEYDRLLSASSAPAGRSPHPIERIARRA